MLSPCRGSISGFLGSFQSGGPFLGRKALTIERSVMSWCGQCMAAVAAGYRMGLVSAGWPVLLLFCANRRRKRYFHLVGAPFLAL